MFEKRSLWDLKLCGKHFGAILRKIMQNKFCRNCFCNQLENLKLCNNIRLNFTELS